MAIPLGPGHIGADALEKVDDLFDANKQEPQKDQQRSASPSSSRSAEETLKQFIQQMVNNLVLSLHAWAQKLHLSKEQALEALVVLTSLENEAQLADQERAQQAVQQVKPQPQASTEQLLKDLEDQYKHEGEQALLDAIAAKNLSDNFTPSRLHTLAMVRALHQTATDILTVLQGMQPGQMFSSQEWQQLVQLRQDLHGVDGGLATVLPAQQVQQLAQLDHMYQQHLSNQEVGKQIRSRGMFGPRPGGGANAKDDEADTANSVSESSRPVIDIPRPFETPQLRRDGQKN